MAKKDRENTPPPVSAVFLTGFMCAGKTSAGRLLAGKLGLPFRDSDALVARRAGGIAALVRKRGLAAFRRLEAAAVKELAAAGGVIALGGGVYPSRRWRGPLARAGVTVFISCPWKELEARLRTYADGRPLLAGPWPAAAQRARKLYARRLPFYRRADLTVNAAGLDPAGTAELIRKKLCTPSASR